MAVDRDALARYVHRSIAELARGAAWSTAEREDGVDLLTQGDYTDAIDDSLRQLGYVDEDGLPDATLVEATAFTTVSEMVRRLSLERLSAYYATVVDTVGGPVRIYRSQVREALSQLGASTSGRRLGTSMLGSATVTSILQDD